MAGHAFAILRNANLLSFENSGVKKTEVVTSLLYEFLHCLASYFVALSVWLSYIYLKRTVDFTYKQRKAKRVFHISFSNLATRPLTRTLF